MQTDSTSWPFRIFTGAQVLWSVAAAGFDLLPEAIQILILAMTFDIACMGYRLTVQCVRGDPNPSSIRAAFLVVLMKVGALLAVAGVFLLETRVLPMPESITIGGVALPGKISIYVAAWFSYVNLLSGYMNLKRVGVRFPPRLLAIINLSRRRLDKEMDKTDE